MPYGEHFSVGMKSDMPPLAGVARRLLKLLFYSALVGLSIFIATLLHFDGKVPHSFMALFIRLIPWLLVIRLFGNMAFRLHESLWRYTSVLDLRNIIGSVISSSIVFAVLVYYGFGISKFPASIIIIDSIILVGLLGGIRLGRRLLYKYEPAKSGKRVLIVGAGDAGEMIVRDMENNSFYGYSPVGFIDDDPTKQKMAIHGVRVLGTHKDFGKVILQVEPDEILIAIPSAAPQEIRQVISQLEQYKIPIKTLPNLNDILDGKVSVNQIRNLSMEDLLVRTPLRMEGASFQQYLKGKRVLVTGAGGSIGSELCRQILDCGPSSLVLFDQHENSIFHLKNELTERSHLPVSGLVGNITEKMRVNEVFSVFRPEIVFHAAAHKHVPVMEENPFEAVKNNILGTWRVLSTSIECGVENFVLISTDKAVSPTNFMGATKRIAEIMIQSMNGSGNTRLVGVRFGNVLGSQGSAVPIFMDQIRRGGPVTITHPDMYRYFMLIPEAVQLVLQASSMGRGGELFVLEMGEQLRVLDVAKNLIRLSGFVPEKEIEIHYVGLRPGEKMREELFDPRFEDKLGTENSHVHQLISRKIPMRDVVQGWLAEMEEFLGRPERSIEDLVIRIQNLVPTFQPEITIARKVLERQMRSGSSILSE